MKTENIKQGIQELLRDNIRLYPAQYTPETYQDTAMTVAIGYYENRTEQEIERDAELEITVQDYIDWCLTEATLCLEDGLITT